METCMCACVSVCSIENSKPYNLRITLANEPKFG